MILLVPIRWSINKPSLWWLCLNGRSFSDIHECSCIPLCCRHTAEADQLTACFFVEIPCTNSMYTFQLIMVSASENFTFSSSESCHLYGPSNLICSWHSWVLILHGWIFFLLLSTSCLPNQGFTAIKYWEVAFRTRTYARTNLTDVLCVGEGEEVHFGHLRAQL